MPVDTIQVLHIALVCISVEYLTGMKKTHTQTERESHEFFHLCGLMSLPVCVSKIRSSEIKCQYSSKKRASIIASRRV